ncbi:glutamine synthetase [Thermocatellispora tengchongensis]|uniref:Glutamine synthetase n=1 Tax=Thermocatellispora tengchongensis TaxID=1073253 RepID=A0A840P1V0_9ACTN|nr:glutamine synthetase [Thermocatellispora tengchongensis]MBB5131871.1 glutamine synthetase [Thermocatellispora tengchongensis]
MTTTVMPTELDRHRERNTDEAALKAIEERIADAGVQYLYYQAVTVTGRVVGKVVPAHHLRRNAERGVQLHGTAVSDLQTDRAGALLGGGVEATEFTAVPDLDTFAVLPWDTTVGRFFCRLYEPAHLPEIGGSPLATDVRGNLIRIHAGFTARTGLELRTGCEPEMTWSGPGLDARFRPGSSPAYHVEHLERYRPIYQKVITYGRALGLDMIEGDYEDPGQLELNWMYDHADRTADRLIVYRQICRQVARELGVTASFMPKPATGMMGNGCHHNISLWRGEQNVLADPGVTELHLTETGRHALGGILTHAAGSMAVMGSTVNSYKRYWDSGQFAPSQINWGMDNKTCTVRLSANGRLEFKLPDAMVNPYLSHALLIAAVEDGIANRIDPGPPHRGSSYTGEAAFAGLPLTLGEALDAFAASPIAERALGPALVDLYTSLKRDEWARFCGAVTDWERMMYAEELP